MKTGTLIEFELPYRDKMERAIGFVYNSNAPHDEDGLWMIATTLESGATTHVPLNQVPHRLVKTINL